MVRAWSDITWCCGDVTWCCGDVTWCCGDVITTPRHVAVSLI